MYFVNIALTIIIKLLGDIIRQLDNQSNAIIDDYLRPKYNVRTNVLKYYLQV